MPPKPPSKPESANQDDKIGVQQPSAAKPAGAIQQTAGQVRTPSNPMGPPPAGLVPAKPVAERAGQAQTGTTGADKAATTGPTVQAPVAARAAQRPSATRAGRAPKATAGQAPTATKAGQGPVAQAGAATPGAVPPGVPPSAAMAGQGPGVEGESSAGAPVKGATRGGSSSAGRHDGRGRAAGPSDRGGMSGPPGAGGPPTRGGMGRAPGGGGAGGPQGRGGMAGAPGRGGVRGARGRASGPPGVPVGGGFGAGERGLTAASEPVMIAEKIKATYNHHRVYHWTNPFIVRAIETVLATLMVAALIMADLPLKKSVWIHFNFASPTIPIAALFGVAALYHRNPLDKFFTLILLGFCLVCYLGSVGQVTARWSEITRNRSHRKMIWEAIVLLNAAMILTLIVDIILYCCYLIGCPCIRVMEKQFAGGKGDKKTKKEGESISRYGSATDVG